MKFHSRQRTSIRDFGLSLNSLLIDLTNLVPNPVHSDTSMIVNCGFDRTKSFNVSSVNLVHPLKWSISKLPKEMVSYRQTSFDQPFILGLSPIILNPVLTTFKLVSIIFEEPLISNSFKLCNCRIGFVKFLQLDSFKVFKDDRIIRFGECNKGDRSASKYSSWVLYLIKDSKYSS